MQCVYCIFQPDVATQIEFGIKLKSFIVLAYCVGPWIVLEAAQLNVQNGWQFGKLKLLNRFDFTTFMLVTGCNTTEYA